jgi:hypothetical protein
MPGVLGISNNTLSVTRVDQAGAVTAARLPALLKQEIIMREKYTVNGRVFTLYGKSIQVEGIADFFFYNRPVEKKDVTHLVKLIELGRQEKIDQIKYVLDL